MTPPTLPCDVIIVGGGPAGCAAAIGLRQANVSCALLERSRYDRPRFGESLPPAAKPLLRALGVWDQFRSDGHLPSPGNLSVWGDPIPGETAFIADPHGPGWHVDRLRFDRMLFDAAARTAAAQEGVKAIDCRRAAGGWAVTADGPRERLRYTAHFLVDATGRRRPLAGLTTRSARIHDRLLAVVGTCGDADTCHEDRRTWVEAVEDGWWYTAPVPGRRVVAAFMTDATVLRGQCGSLAGFLDRQLQQAGVTESRLSARSGWSNVTVLSALSYLSSMVVGADFLAVGDAAAAFDPLSSEGLCKALREGLLAARTIGRHLHGDADALQDYASDVRRGFSDFARQHRWMYGLERRWPSSDFWRRRHEGLQ